MHTYVRTYVHTYNIHNTYGTLHISKNTTYNIYTWNHIYIIIDSYIYIYILLQIPSGKFCCVFACKWFRVGTPKQKMLDTWLSGLLTELCNQVRQPPERPLAKQWAGPGPLELLLMEEILHHLGCKKPCK